MELTQQERESAYKKFIEKWGVDAQIMMCIEEMSELQKALCKYLRYGKENSNAEIKYNVIEEIADVANMIGQLEYIFDEKIINEIKCQKIERCLNKIKGAK